MTPTLQSLSGIPFFLLYLVVALVFVTIFALIYTALTPQRELELLRAGNKAAAYSLGGALLGFAIPLAKSIEQSRDLWDMAIWSTVALVVQLIVFFIASLILPGLGKRIAADDHAAGLFAAACAVGVGLLSSASMTY
jgi:putative membrane protein